jgi:hypothetical protein
MPHPVQNRFYLIYTRSFLPGCSVTTVYLFKEIKLATANKHIYVCHNTVYWFSYCKCLKCKQNMSLIFFRSTYSYLEFSTRIYRPINWWFILNILRHLLCIQTRLTERRTGRNICLVLWESHALITDSLCWWCKRDTLRCVLLNQVFVSPSNP